MSIQSASNELHERAKSYAATHSSVSYIDAVRHVLANDSDLASRYDGGNPSKNTVTQDSIELDSLAREYMEDHPGIDYIAGCKIVFAQAREEARQYSQSRGKEVGRRVVAYSKEFGLTGREAEVKVFADDPQLALDVNPAPALPRAAILIGGAATSGGIMDSNLALKIAAIDPDLFSRAASERLTNIAFLRVGMTPGPSNAAENQAAILVQVRKDHPALEAMWLKNTITVEGLRQLLPSMRFSEV